ncbi:MAG TPA: M1 family metallopeptidase [Gemmataceae bacterium]|nr:M1 family metallopeptidase [Gemmataceae bacterium]
MDRYRLPRTVVPSRYDIRLEPDLAAATFAGRVTIAVTVHEPVEEIVLNAAELCIKEAAAEGMTPHRQIAAVTMEEDTERCRLRFPAALMKGPWRLNLTFTGTLNDKLRGFYRSKYKNKEGEWRWLAATQFEATDARRAFPCWDEPAFKAVFASTLVVDPALQVVSNTAVAVQRAENGKMVVRFADTIPMSTYLVAYIVGELEATDAAMVGAAPLRVWCVPGKERLTRFGRDIGAFSLGYFEEYYGRKYPGDKLDLIAIPDFAAGAMENLGAITFRETALLVDEATATHAERERVADVVAHENAHMWFGDLVTMSWWNGIWLNEAFATFMEMLAVDAWKPEWQRWTTFGASRSAALAVDGLRSSRPIEVAVEAPKDADAMFDVLTYEKGASVLRMLEQYIGPAVFRDGVRHYLDRHAFGSTETSDLWRALGEASKLPIPEVMDGWIYHPGYPLIDVELTPERRVVLRQQRFLYLGAEPGPAEEHVWRTPVQLRFIGCGDRTEQTLLGADAATFEMGRANAALVNAGGHGFYRVRYSPNLLKLLLQHLWQLEAIERFNLVNDAWAAVLAGLTPLAEYLDLTSHFRGEHDKNVWSVIVGSFHTLNRIVEPADRPRLSALVRDRLAPAAAQLDWRPQPRESELTGQLRADLLRALGTVGDDADVQARAAELFAGHPVDANVFAAIVSILAHAGDAGRYAEFERRCRTARTPQEEQRYLLALAAFREPELIDRTMARLLDGDVRTQDAPFVLRALLMNVDGREKAWMFLEEKWDRLNQVWPTNGVRRVLEGIVGLATPEWERRVRAFCEAKKVNLGGKTLEQYLEQLHVVVRLREREAGALRNYLPR